MSIEFEALTGCLGARVAGADFSADLSDDNFDVVRGALFHYKALVFPAQEMSPAAHVELGRRFGDEMMALPLASSPCKRFSRAGLVGKAGRWTAACSRSRCCGRGTRRSWRRGARPAQGRADPSGR